MEPLYTSWKMQWNFSFVWSRCWKLLDDLQHGGQELHWVPGYLYPHVLHCKSHKHNLFRVEVDPIIRAMFQETAWFPKTPLYCLNQLTYIINTFDIVVSVPQDVIKCLWICIWWCQPHLRTCLILIRTAGLWTLCLASITSPTLSYDNHSMQENRFSLYF